MIAFKTILCPIDFSETAARALAYATAIATWYEARLTILHVAPAFNESIAVDEAPREPYPGSRDDVMARLGARVNRRAPRQSIRGSSPRWAARPRSS